MELSMRIKEAAAYLRSRVSHLPEVGLVLGSGLGDYAGHPPFPCAHGGGSQRRADLRQEMGPVGGGHAGPHPLL